MKYKTLRNKKIHFLDEAKHWKNKAARLLTNTENYSTDATFVKSQQLRYFPVFPSCRTP